MNRVLARPDAPSLPEEEVFGKALAAWLDQLRAEALRRAAQHPLWAHAAEGFEGDLAEQARGHYRHGLRSFQLGLNEEVERTARAIYEELEKSPARLVRTWFSEQRPLHSPSA